MSSIALSGSVVAGSRTDRQRRRAGVSKRHFAKIVIATIGPATLAYFLADLFVHYHPDFVILQTVWPAVMFAVIPAVVGPLLYAGLLRFTALPVRIFNVVSAIVFVVMTVPDFTYIPGVEGASTAQAAVLVLMHVVAAGIITGMLTTLAPPALS